MIPIVTPAEMRAIDAAVSEPVEALIDRAGRRLARHARSMLGGVYGRRVVVVAGPGNNGADGRVAASRLRSWGAAVAIVPADVAVIPQCDLVIDAAFGTGMSRPYNAAAAPPGARVLAVDIPSGVDGLTGETPGRVLEADETLTFAALKPGLLLHPGASLSGRVEVADIGLDVSGASAWLITEHDVRSLLPTRSPNAHKWKRAVHVVGGSAGMIGAPVLAATAALRSGAGMVWCGLVGANPPALASELVFVSLDTDTWHAQVMAEAGRFAALVVGCGLGRSEAAVSGVRRLVAEATTPMVIDGDALRHLGPAPRLRRDIVLTPHDGEFEALTGARPPADRFAGARALASATGATVVLKGPLTIVADPDGSCLCANRGDQRLATAGTGDVLAGVIGSLLAAGLAPVEAGAVGAWVHGDAGRNGPAVGMVASDLFAGLVDSLGPLSPQHTGGGPDASN